MKLEFDKNSPIYLQLAEYIKQDILAENLCVGDPIPSVRQISVQTSLNPQTVLKATQILIQEGLIEKKRGLGMFIKEGAKEILLKKEVKIFKEKEIREFVKRAKLLQFDEKKLLQMISAITKEWK